jgi:hypothetical protein
VNDIRTVRIDIPQDDEEQPAAQHPTAPVCHDDNNDDDDDLYGSARFLILIVVPVQLTVPASTVNHTHTKLEYMQLKLIL